MGRFGRHIWSWSYILKYSWSTGRHLGSWEVQFKLRESSMILGSTAESLGGTCDLGKYRWSFVSHIWSWNYILKYSGSTWRHLGSWEVKSTLREAYMILELHSKVQLKHWETSRILGSTWDASGLICYLGKYCWSTGRHLGSWEVYGTHRESYVILGSTAEALGDI